jgi:hypothetical protein
VYAGFAILSNPQQSSDLLALDQFRGQARDPKVVKHSWENTFDRL